MFGSIGSVTGLGGCGSRVHRAPARGALFRAHLAKSRASPGMLFIPTGAGHSGAASLIAPGCISDIRGDSQARAASRSCGSWSMSSMRWVRFTPRGRIGAAAQIRCRCVLGFQSIAQVSGTYGHGEAQTIVENCGNTLILRCSGSENGGTSLFASRLIGDREVIRSRHARKDRESGFSTRGGRRSHSIRSAGHRAGSHGLELEQLPDLCVT